MTVNIWWWNVTLWWAAFLKLVQMKFIFADNVLFRPSRQRNHTPCNIHCNWKQPCLTGYTETSCVMSKGGIQKKVATGTSICFKCRPGCNEWKIQKSWHPFTWYFLRGYIKRPVHTNASNMCKLYSRDDQIKRIWALNKIKNKYSSWKPNSKWKFNINKNNTI